MNEELRNKLQRYQRRHLIDKEIASGVTSQDEIKKTVRNEEKDRQDTLEQLFTEIVQNESILHPESAQVARELQTHLQKEFPEYDIAIILIGSAVTGGKRIRELFMETLNPSKDDEHIPDFDFVLEIGHKDSYLGEEDIDQDIFEEIDLVASLFLTTKGTKICKHFRPSKFAIRPLTKAYDIREQNEFITKEGALIDEMHSVYSLLFAPSFPPQSNERNRKIFLQFLTALYRHDSDEWNTIVSDLIEEWKQIHTLKRKYFSSESIKRPDFDTTTQQFTQLRLEVFKKLLKTTTDETGALYIDYM